MFKNCKRTIWYWIDWYLKFNGVQCDVLGVHYLKCLGTQGGGSHRMLVPLWRQIRRFAEFVGVIPFAFNLECRTWPLFDFKVLRMDSFKILLVLKNLGKHRGIVSYLWFESSSTHFGPALIFCIIYLFKNQLAWKRRFHFSWIWKWKDESLAFMQHHVKVKTPMREPPFSPQKPVRCLRLPHTCNSESERGNNWFDRCDWLIWLSRTNFPANELFFGEIYSWCLLNPKINKNQLRSILNISDLSHPLILAAPPQRFLLSSFYVSCCLWS